MLKATVLALALVVAATAAHAADACYQGVGGSILVFKRFKLPRANDCLPITGYQHNSNCTLTGTACGTSDGFQVNFNFQQICHFSGFGTYSLFTDRSIQQGDGLFCQQNLSTGQFSCPTFNAARVSCPTTPSITEF